MDIRNVAIVGCGSIYENHAKALAANEGVKLFAFCDIKKERAIAAANKYGGSAVFDFEDILSDKSIDSVHICTPHYLHAPMAIAALKSGKHVLVEKPVAMNAKEAAEVIKAAQESDRTIGVCFQNRYNVTSLKVKELLEDNAVGRVLGARAFVTWCREGKYYTESDWRGKWSTAGGGVLINQAIHTIDLLQWFMGDVLSVSGNASTRKLQGVIEVEDTAEAYIRFKSGSSALFFASNCYVGNAPISVEILCENATLKMEDDLTVKWKDGRTEVWSDSVKASGDKSYWGLGHANLINDFYNKIESGESFAIDPAEASRSIEIIDGIRKEN